MKEFLKELLAQLTKYWYIVLVIIIVTVLVFAFGNTIWDNNQNLYWNMQKFYAQG